MAGAYIIPLSNFTATVDPTVNDDVTLGYSVGSPWVNTLTGFVFVLVNPATDAADWQQVYPVSMAVTLVTADTTLTAAHTLVLADASAGPITITLPTAVGIEGRLYVAKKIDSSANPVTIEGTVSEDNVPETIDGGLTAVLTDQDEAVPFVSNNVNWNIAF